MLKGLLETILNGAGQNIVNLLGVTLGGIIVTYSVKFLIWIYKKILQWRIGKLIVKFIPQGIAFGDILKGTKPNHEVLFQAVLTVKNLVLKAFPPKLRGTVDKLIDTQKIVNGIELSLNEEKQEGLAKPTAE